jgi:HEAT repeat protein
MKQIKLSLFVALWLGCMYLNNLFCQGSNIALEKKITELIELLKNPDLNIRLQSAETLGKIGKKARRAVPYLVEALKEEQSYMDQAMKNLFQTVGLTEALTKKSSIQYQHILVKAAIANALGEVGRDTAEAVPALIDLLKDPYWPSRSAAAKALNKLGEKAVDATPHIIQCFKERYSYLELYSELTDALVAIGEKAVPQLIQALRDDNKQVRGEAMLTLHRIGEKAIPYLIQVLKDPEENVHVRYGVSIVLADIGEKAVPQLIQALRNEQRFVRAASAHALGQIGMQEAFYPLQEALQRETIKEVKEAIEKALNTIKK